MSEKKDLSLKRAWKLSRSDREDASNIKKKAERSLKTAPARISMSGRHGVLLVLLMFGFKVNSEFSLSLI